MLNKDYKLITEKLVVWIQQKVKEAGCKGAVVGLSGGIDSSVTAALCKKAFPENTLGLIMPCESNPEDQKDAKLLAEKFEIEYKKIDLASVFNSMLDVVDLVDDQKLSLANIKPRLRMTTLYYYASLNGYLVVGTDNRSELKLGYFTKFGDGGIDLAPLGNLVKSEVREVARVLGVPEKIITKAPSAGLWAGQTDESELGITYEEVDNYILTGEASSKVKEIVDTLEEKNQHKLALPPIPSF
ncbi:NAD+ synthase [Orenia metallireducens]|uniref:NH(3)-dependent NAD(+) synthetase n=1 Tax=Orenia metallireducens TaxID=1413210 RepID=A0A285GGL4_9FIRM|nr:NAD+ synthase [Orenia metallireducens]PRX30406.1 NAD+ synthase [Orenia metallireducens]SNY22334.1 NAD+ synthase [Orenia metallireducens]